MDAGIWHQSILGRKLIVKRDWFEDIFGFVPYLFFLVISAFFLFFEQGGIISFVFFCLFFYAVVQGFYSLRHENDLLEIRTNFSAKYNRQVLLSAIQSLDWSLRVNENIVVAADIQNGLGFVNQSLTTLITDEVIYFNIKHKGTSKGRIPFFFGLNNKKGAQLTRMIEQYNFEYHGLLQRP